MNVQDVREFPCQQLNRDVWSNEAVRNIIKERFVLWQVWALFNFYVTTTFFFPPVNGHLFVLCHATPKHVHANMSKPFLRKFAVIRTLYIILSLIENLLNNSQSLAVNFSKEIVIKNN